MALNYNMQLLSRMACLAIKQISIFRQRMVYTFTVAFCRNVNTMEKVLLLEANLYSSIKNGTHQLCPCPVTCYRYKKHLASGRKLVFIATEWHTSAVPLSRNMLPLKKYLASGRKLVFIDEEWYIQTVTLSHKMLQLPRA